jgi:hypothetical protein
MNTIFNYICYAIKDTFYLATDTLGFTNPDFVTTQISKNGNKLVGCRKGHCAFVVEHTTDGKTFVYNIKDKKVNKLDYYTFRLALEFYSSYILKEMWIPMTAEDIQKASGVIMIDEEDISDSPEWDPTCL